MHGIACGLRAKNCYQDMVEQAKAEVDDLVAEATYLTSDAKAARPIPSLPPNKTPTAFVMKFSIIKEIWQGPPEIGGPRA